MEHEQAVEQGPDQGTVRSDRGASVVEYALLLALIAIVCVAAVSAVGRNLNSSYSRSNTSIFGP